MVRYNQHSGLAMRSTLSEVATCLFMEMLKQDEYINIVGRETKWVRYIDDILVIAPANMNIKQKLEHLYGVSDRIKFTVELKTTVNYLS